MHHAPNPAPWFAADSCIPRYTPGLGRGSELSASKTSTARGARPLLEEESASKAKGWWIRSAGTSSSAIEHAAACRRVLITFKVSRFSEDTDGEAEKPIGSRTHPGEPMCRESHLRLSGRWCAPRDSPPLSPWSEQRWDLRFHRARDPTRREARRGPKRPEARGPRPWRERPVTAQGLCHTRSVQTNTTQQLLLSSHDDYLSQR